MTTLIWWVIIKYFTALILQQMKVFVKLSTVASVVIARKGISILYLVLLYLDHNNNNSSLFTEITCGHIYIYIFSKICAELSVDSINCFGISFIKTKLPTLNLKGLLPKFNFLCFISSRGCFKLCSTSFCLKAYVKIN